MRPLRTFLFIFLGLSAATPARANYEFAHAPVHAEQHQQQGQKKKPFFEHHDENALPTRTWGGGGNGRGGGGGGFFGGGNHEPFFKSSFSSTFGRVKIVPLGGDHALHTEHAQSTPYGYTKVEHAGGTLVHKVTIARQTYKVSRRQDGMLVYTDEHGKAHEGVVREGGGIRTPEGLTTSVETPNGRRDVLVSHFNSGATQYQEVKIEGGKLHYEPIQPFKTAFGETQIAIVGDKLVQQIALPGHTLQAAKRPDGTIVYTDEHGHNHTGVVRIGGHLLTQAGLTSTKKMHDGTHEIVVNDIGTFRNSIKQYRRVEEQNGELKLTLLHPMSTEYGNAYFVESADKLEQVVNVQGKPYRVSRNAQGRVVLTDEQGHASEGFLRHGDAIVTPYGLTQRVKTDDGRTIDVVHDARPGWKFGVTDHLVVRVEDGRLQYLPVASAPTIYGNTHAVIADGRLKQSVIVRGKQYTVEEHAGHLRFIDAHGHHSDDAIVLADGIETPKGFAKTLVTPTGKLHVLAIPRTWGNLVDYVSVTLKDGVLHEEKLSSIDTMYGTTRLAIGETHLSNHVEIDGHKFEVSRMGNELVYTDEHGKAHHGRIHFEHGVKTPHGQSTTVLTADGPRDVVTLSDGARAYVDWKRGAMELTRIQAIPTSYGSAQPTFEAGRLAWHLDIHGHAFEVVQRDGTPVYIDKHGTKQTGIVRIGKHLALPGGLTSTLKIDGVEREVMVSADGTSFSEVSEDGQRVTPIVSQQTLHGPTKVVRVGDEIKQEIQLEGRPFYAVRHGASMQIVDAHGAPYVDTYASRVTSSHATPFTARRTFVAGLASLPDAEIATIGGHAHMSKATYDQLRDAVLETFHKLDPRTHYFIGLGSDPHPIVAFFENVGGKGLATNFPASGKYHGGLDPKVLDPYVRKLIPPEVLNGSKTLVLLDQTTSGDGRAGTLAQITPVFEQYLRMLGSPAKVVKLAYSPNSHPDGTVTVDTRKYPEVGRFLGSPYEHIVSQWPRHVLGVNKLDDLVEQPNYEAFKTAMRERMKRDEKLDAFLVGVGASQAAH